MKQYLSRKLLSPGVYKQSLTRNLNEKLRSYKSSHFWREISKLIKFETDRKIGRALKLLR